VKGRKIGVALAVANKEDGTIGVSDPSRIKNDVWAGLESRTLAEAGRLKIERSVRNRVQVQVWLEQVRSTGIRRKK
jgi:hypothetical protein